MSLDQVIYLFESRVQEILAAKGTSITNENSGDFSEADCPCVVLSSSKHLTKDGLGSVDSKTFQGTYDIKIFDKKGVGSRAAAKIVDELIKEIEFKRYSKDSFSILFKDVSVKRMPEPQGYFGLIISINYEI